MSLSRLRSYQILEMRPGRMWGRSCFYRCRWLRTCTHIDMGALKFNGNAVVLPSRAQPSPPDPGHSAPALKQSENRTRAHLCLFSKQRNKNFVAAHMRPKDVQGCMRRGKRETFYFPLAISRPERTLVRYVLAVISSSCWLRTNLITEQKKYLNSEQKDISIQSQD